MVSNRTGQDDIAAAPLLHVRQHRMHGPERRVDVEVKHAIPLVGITVQDFAVDISTGIGVEDVEPSSEAEDLRHHCGDACLVHQISCLVHQIYGERDRFRPEFATERRQPVNGTVHQNDPNAFGQQGSGTLKADARSSAGDRGDFAFQKLRHDDPPASVPSLTSFTPGRGRRGSGGRASR